MELAIYNRQGTLKRKVSPDSSSRWTEEVGTEFVVTVNFTTWEFFVLSVGDYVEISGKRFSIRKEYRPKKTDTQKYTYNISFYGREHDMQDLLFCRLNQGEDDLESVFAYDGTPMEMLEKLVANMNRNTDGVTWRAGQAVTGDRKTINFNGLFCWDAAGEIAGAWETEWWLDGEYLNIGKCEHGERVTLGYMKGLKTGLTQNENSNSIKWFTRLIPVGSTKNIDPSKYGYTHLQLPSRDKYIDLNTQLGLKEHREEAAFQDIFPHRLGTVSSVRSEEQTNTDGEEYTVYYIKDKDLPFNPDEYMISEEVIHITFESGDLSGREFECNWHNGTQEFEIINTYPDENTQIPGGNIIPNIGDTYILTNIRMPDEYYPIAEEQYKQAVDSFLTEYSKDISIYSGDTDYIHVDKNSVPLSLGQRVRLEDAQYFEAGYLDTRITRIERKLGNLSEASIDCSSAVSTSWKSSVDSTLNNLEYTLAQEMADNVRLLKTGDMESPSDYTAFSSLRAIATFLCKDRPDRTNFLLKFGDFIDSMIAGKGAGIYPDGRGQFERLEVRGSAVFKEVIYNRLNAQEGDTSYSENGVIESVTLESDGTYTLKLRKRWENDFTAFQEGDVVYGIVNNLFSTGEYYTSWVRVLSKNIAANSISVLVYPDSEVPGGRNYPPTELMIITRRGNAINEDRQSYWYLSATTDKCLVWLEGVTKPVLEQNNYYMILGRLPNLDLFDNLPINYKHSYIFARAGIFGELYRVDWQGLPVQELVDRGFWSAEVASSENPYTNTQERADTVWHYGCKWKCLMTGTADEPQYAAAGWAMLEGNPEFTIEIGSTKGWYFDIETFSTTLYITGKLYNRDVTDHILDADVSWTRDTGNVSEDNAWAVKRAGAGKNLPLTIDDLGPNYTNMRVCTFKAQALLRDGQQFEVAENFVTF
ncbi:hypothetical protein [Phocaeicola dorei]|jgi:hypothetical protein|uniref:hypothetical protein n=1 Tax=Phocaeicola dorei TaxID=357276 RepID=UPI000A80E522|nr:hypothetical protein [Phocaeicola dorei]